MSLPQVEKLKISHEAIMDYMLANPSCTYREVSSQFGYTIPWISCIVNSDAFRDRLREKQSEMFDAGVLAPLETKMKGVVDLTLQRLAEKVQVAESLPDLTNTADKLLGRLGYGSGPSGEQGAFTFAPTLIQRAQILMGKGNNQLVEAHSSDRESGADQASTLFESQSEDRSESCGSSLRTESAPLDGVEV